MATRLAVGRVRGMERRRLAEERSGPGGETERCLGQGVGVARGRRRAVTARAVPSRAGAEAIHHALPAHLWLGIRLVVDGLG